MNITQIVEVYGKGKIQNFLTFNTLLKKYDLSIEDLSEEIERQSIVELNKLHQREAIEHIYRPCPKCKHSRIYTTMNTGRRNKLDDHTIKGTWFCDSCGDQEDMY